MQKNTFFRELKRVCKPMLGENSKNLFCSRFRGVPLYPSNNLAEPRQVVNTLSFPSRAVNLDYVKGLLIDVNIPEKYANILLEVQLEYVVSP